MFTIESFIENQRTSEGEAGIFMLNGSDLTQEHWDPGLRRPYRAENGRVYVDVYQGQKLVTNADGSPVYNAQGMPEYRRIYQPQLVTERLREGLPVLAVDNATTLTKDAWLRLDAAVQASVRPRLRAYADLRAANTFGGFDGMATPILEHEIMTDPGEAVMDMEGLDETARNAAPKFALQGLPLPITHSDFHLPQRFLAASRAKGQPQDMLRAEIAGRRVGEMIEKATIGTISALQYGASTEYLRTSKVYGYITHPARITKTDLQTSANMATNLAGAGGTGAGGTLFVNDVLEMIAAATAYNFYGPYMLYVSTAYDNLLDNDFKAEVAGTIRQRVKMIDKIQDVRRLDYLTGDVMLLVQMTPDVCQAVNGLEVTTVQWESHGGMKLNFKVMGIQVPRIRSVYTTYNGVSTEKCGVVHGTTS